MSETGGGHASGDTERSKEMEGVAKSLRRTAETLEQEAISVKYNGEPDDADYLDYVCNDSLEKLRSLQPDTDREEA